MYHIILSVGVTLSGVIVPAVFIRIQAELSEMDSSYFQLKMCGVSFYAECINSLGINTPSLEETTLKQY